MPRCLSLALILALAAPPAAAHPLARAAKSSGRQPAGPSGHVFDDMSPGTSTTRLLARAPASSDPPDPAANPDARQPPASSEAAPGDMSPRTFAPPLLARARAASDPPASAADLDAWQPSPPAPPPAPEDLSSGTSPPAPDPVARPVPAGDPPLPPAPPPLPPHLMRLRPAVDVPVITLGLVLWLGTDLAARDMGWSGCQACDRSHINGLDRRVLGNESLAAAHASDALLYTAIAAPLVADLADTLVTGRRAPGSYRHAAGGWARDVVVLFEVLAVNVGLNNLVKYAVRRPRPYSYEPASDLGDVQAEEARLSFYSGHTSTAFAMMSAWATLFTLRHPRARTAVPAWLVAVGLAAATGVLRVEAGKHFWTDVLFGSLAGTAVGVLVPLLHRNDRGRRVSAGMSPTPRGALVSLTGRF
ncbi:Membrane-associated phospholipid phosphatase [Nannocystis exedens]|uniref:Membrane-associated phospholipid phosphatase n=1 Tax=Nannocystis exedens TaxID=54 RepID=A0A1I2H299_9BACT|nr:phosphatase PAP2 family protein [Nannocystis exedens]PCC67104.1 PAP2 superfamily protein [Nannocystis exedens]SFF23822.1 Membrane-associated phospholipid phosphatase [Nannocystis exedens]